MSLSCEEIQDFIDPKGHGLVFLEGEMKAYFDDKGDTKNYKFKADLAWSAEVSTDWIEVDPTSGPAGENKIKIKVDKNKSDEKRTGYVDVTLSNDKSYRIELEQLASGESLDDITPSVSIPNNEIWYTTIDGEVLTLISEWATFNVEILSNTYIDGKGIIKFSGDVTSIGEWAFSGCDNLTSITIPDSVTTIRYAAFDSCSSLTSVIFGDSVTAIEDYAFSGCSSLTSVTIPDSVTAIKREAFSYCSSLTSVTIPDSVISIGDTAFFSCSSLTEFNGKYASEDGRCLIIDGSLNSFAPAGLTEYTIPNSVTTIVGFAFCNCSSLTSITIPNSVTTIGNNPFLRCSGLTEIKGKFASEDGRCLIIDGVLNSFAPAGLTEYTVPDSVTTIGGSAFSGCSSLTSVTIPDSVAIIGWYAFSGCSSLTSVTIPDSVTTIEAFAFDDCSSLTSVTIPDGVTEIGDLAFYGCSSLTSVTIGDSVTTIGEGAFCGCRSLTSVYCKATTPPHVGAYVFWTDQPLAILNCTFYVPMQSVEAYKSADDWSDYADRIVGYNF